MEPEPLDPVRDVSAMRECHGIFRLGAPADAPGLPVMSLHAFTGWLTYGWSEDPTQTWLVRDSDGVAGWYLMSLPERENRDLAYVRPFAHPARRRQGTGTLLLRHAAGQARDAGRTMLASEAQAGTPGTWFARAAGAEQGITEVLRVLRLDTADRGRLAKLREQVQAAAAGYELCSWTGATAEDLLDQLADVFGAMADAPHDATVGAQRWEADRVRHSDERVRAQGSRYYTVAARHLASGRLAAATQLAVDPGVPEWGLQELTAVARPHRGHRLGLAVKLAMLDLLAEREPQLTSVITGNADTNQHMIAINAGLGFEVLAAVEGWYLSVRDALVLPHVMLTA